MSNLYNSFRRHDAISAFLYGSMPQGIQNEYYSVRYNPGKSTPQEVNVAFTFRSNEGEGEQMSKVIKITKANIRDRSQGNLAAPSSYGNRVEELLRNVQAEITGAKAHVIDISLNFGGKGGQSGYSFTAAHAKSPVSEKSRLLMYYNGQPFQSSEHNKPFQVR